LESPSSWILETNHCGRRNCEFCHCAPAPGLGPPSASRSRQDRRSMWAKADLPATAAQRGRSAHRNHGDQMSSHQLQTEIDIAATPERVWSILTNFSAYTDWNPFIRFIRGEPEQGARLVVRIQPSGTKGMTFRPVVLTAVRARELRWLGRFVIPWLLEGEHRFAIRPIHDGRVRFRQSELFSGILVPMFRAGLDRDTKRGFEEMNLALKVRAEASEAPNKATESTR
jgi:hypothetical protein